MIDAMHPRERCGLWLLPACAAAMLLFPGVSRAAPGDLDPSFGDGGTVRTDFGGDVYGELQSVAIDSRGRIVAGGFRGNNLALVRYRRDGSLDPSFGAGGIATTDIDGGAFAVALDRKGRIVAAGYARSTPYGSDFAVVRYHSDGSPDDSFGTDGEVTTDLGASEYATSLAIDSHGRIIAAGQRGAFRQWFVLARYKPDGTLDDSFSADGKAIAGFRDVATSARAWDAALESKNRIVTAGTIQTTAAGDDFVLARFSANGVLTRGSFGRSGKVITDFGGSESCHGVAIDPEGRIVAAGDADSNSDFALARYRSNGSLDPSFGSDGRVTTDVGGSADDVAIDSQGRIVAVGYQAGRGNYDDRSAFAVARYNPDGSRDRSFGSNGVVTTDFGADTLDEAFSVAIDAHDRIVAAGGVTPGDYALARYLGQ